MLCITIIEKKITSVECLWNNTELGWYLIQINQASIHFTTTYPVLGAVGGARVYPGWNGVWKAGDGLDILIPNMKFKDAESPRTFA